MPAISCDAATQGRAHRFSPVNQYGIHLTAEYCNPIINGVGSKRGVALQLRIGRTSADTTVFVLANEAGAQRRPQ